MKEAPSSIMFKVSLHSTIMSSKVKLIRSKLIDGLNKLTSGIRLCPKLKYVWKAEDACVSQKTCFTPRKFNVTNQYRRKMYPKFGLARVDCPCKGLYAYECEKSFCTLNKRVCDSMLLKKIHLAQAGVYGIKKCPSKLVQYGTSFFGTFYNLFKILKIGKKQTYY